MQEELIAKKIKEYMAEHGLSQTQFAEKSGVSQPSVWRAVNGKPSKRMGSARRQLIKFLRIGTLSTKKTENQTGDIDQAISKVVEALENFRSAIKNIKT